MKMQEIRQLNDAELVTELERCRRRLFDLRSQAVTEKLEDPALVRKAKKDVARILTEMNSRSVQTQNA